MMKLIAKLTRSKKGATAIEYALIAALIAVIVMAGMRFLGRTMNNTMTRIAGNINV